MGRVKSNQLISILRPLAVAAATLLLWQQGMAWAANDGRGLPDHSTLGIMRALATPCQRALMPGQWPPITEASCTLAGTPHIRDQTTGTCSYHALAAVLDRLPLFSGRPSPVSSSYLILSLHLRRAYNTLLLEAARSSGKLASLAHQSLRQPLPGYSSADFKFLSTGEHIVPHDAFTPTIDIEEYITEEDGLLAHLVRHQKSHQRETRALLRAINDFVLRYVNTSDYSSTQISLSPVHRAIFTQGIASTARSAALYSRFVDFVFAAAPDALGQRPRVFANTSRLVRRSYIRDSEAAEDIDSLGAARSPTDVFVDEESEPSRGRGVSFADLQKKFENSLSRGVPIELTLTWPRQLRSNHEGILYFSSSHVLNLDFSQHHGMHAVTLVGTLRDTQGRITYYKLQNSWGPEVGDGGYHYITPAYLAILLDSAAFFSMQVER